MLSIEATSENLFRVRSPLLHQGGGDPPLPPSMSPCTRGTQGVDLHLLPLCSGGGDPPPPRLLHNPSCKMHKKGGDPPCRKRRWRRRPNPSAPSQEAHRLSLFPSFPSQEMHRGVPHCPPCDVHPRKGVEIHTLTTLCGGGYLW